MILNHAAADTAVQRKLCPNFKHHLLKKLRKNMTLNHATADTKVQQKLCTNFKFHLLKNLEKYIVINTKAKLMISTILDHSASYPILSLGHCTLL